MKTTAPKTPTATSTIIVKSRSLTTRVTIFTLVFFLVGMWSLAFYAGRILRDDMQRILSEQQFSTASIIAGDLNAEFGLRVTSLQTIAERITPAMISNPITLQKMLEGLPIFYSLFNNGAAVGDLDGTVIAEYPRLPGRLGANFKERDYIIGPLKEGKVTIGRPVMSKLMHAPAFVIAAPIRDKHGKVIGVLAGTTDLRLPNFLDKVTNNRYGKTGAYMLVAPQHKLTVTGTDKSRIMQPLPATGINPLFDRYAQGFEGSGVVVDSRGLEVLSSCKQIPVPGWLLIARIPTEEAFAPIRSMQHRMLIATIFLTLLAGGLIWWILRRQLAPVFSTIKRLTDLSNTDHPLQPLPIMRQDEIGALIGSFNHLLKNLEQREAALRESEKKYRTLTETMKDVVWTMEPSTMQFLYVSPSVKKLRGYTAEEIMAEPVTKALTSEAREYVTNITRERTEEVLSSKEPFGKYYSDEVEQTCKDGSTVWTEVITSYYINKQNGHVEVHGVTRDISERKRMEEALKKSEFRYRTVTRLSSDFAYSCMHAGEEGYVLDWMTDNFFTISGFSEKEAYDQRCWIPWAHPDDLEMASVVRPTLLYIY